MTYKHNPKTERLAILKDEHGSERTVSLIRKKWQGKKPFSIALGYGDEYRYAIHTASHQWLYFALNNMPEVVCERVYYPGDEKYALASRAGRGIQTLETGRNLQDFDVIGYTLNYEGLYPHILRMLSLAGIPLKREQRGEDTYPLMLGGGYSATYNPVPLSGIFDAIVIGEAEQIIIPLINACKSSPTNNKRLSALSRIQGIYVPKEHKGQDLQSAEPADLDSISIPGIVTPRSYWPGYYFLEVARGCFHNCLFCVMPRVFRPARFKNVDKVIDEANTMRALTNKIRLISPADTDHPRISEIYNRLHKLGFTIGAGSQRADMLDNTFISHFTETTHGPFTIAPEAATDRLRKTLGKDITNEDIFRSVKLAATLKLKRLRVFFIIGFEGECDDDRREIIHIIQKTRDILDSGGSSGTRITAVVNCHIKKPHTPCERQKQMVKKDYFQEISFLKEMAQEIRGVEIISMDPKLLLIEEILVRGDETSGEVLLESFTENTESSWLRACESKGCSPAEYTRERAKDEVLPWHFIRL